MRPASDVLLHIIVEMATYPDPEYDCLPRNPVAIIEADRKQVREEVVREVCEMIEREFDAPHVIDVSRRITSAIEREFLGEKA